MFMFKHDLIHCMICSCLNIIFSKGFEYDVWYREWQVENILSRANRKGQFETLVYHSAIDPKKVTNDSTILGCAGDGDDPN